MRPPYRPEIEQDWDQAQHQHEQWKAKKEQEAKAARLAASRNAEANYDGDHCCKDCGVWLCNCLDETPPPETEKWADDVKPCGPWAKLDNGWSRPVADPECPYQGAMVLASGSWMVWHRCPDGHWIWERHPAEVSTEAAKAAADRRLRGE